MRRAAALAALLVVLASPAGAQIKITPGDGGGVSGGSSTAGVAVTLGASRLTTMYTFEGSPVGTATGQSSTGSGWKKTSSSTQSELTGAAPIIMSASAPMLNIEMQASGSYQRVQETIGASGVSHIGQHRNDEYRVSFDFNSNPGEYMTTDEGVLQILVGDTTFTKFGKKPKAFGIIFVGSGHNINGWNTIPASWPLDTWIGFVGSGTDTTYVPLKAENITANSRDFWYLYAAPNGGPVSFYCNNTLLATISDVTRDTGLDNVGFVVNVEGGSNGQPEVALGPVSIERNW